MCAGQLYREDKEKITKYVEEGAYLIAVDGGADYCHEMGLSPDLYLGDFDSVSDFEVSVEDVCDAMALDGMEKTPKIVKLPCEKDDTDTLAALRVGIEKGFEVFYIFGGSGGRLDHTVANIQSLLFLRNNGCKGTMINGSERVFVIKNESVSFPASEEGMLSLFALGGKAQGVSIFGMKYNLEDAVLTNDFPIGISNEFVGTEAIVTVREGEVLGIMTRIL